ncbi:MAG: ABC transporter substrate-binding protein [Chloroflexi bacterium]|nr:ABC transporter substrate-binding protein [Chloroflexota bacterium]
MISKATHGWGARRLAILGAVAVVATAATTVSSPDLATAQGSESAELKPISLILNGPAAGSSSGFMYAKSLGLYEAQGLDVRIDESAGSGIAANALAAGQYDFAFANAPTVMLTMSQGAEMKLLSIIHQSNGFAIISLTESDINELADLEGKWVAAAPATAQLSIFDAVLGSNGLTDKVNVVNIDASALEAALLERRVDAILGAAVANSINLRAIGADVTDLLFSDMGVPTVGLGIATSDALIANDPETVRKFMAASIEGWDRARQDPAAVAAAVFEQFPAGQSESTLLAQTEAVTTLSLCVPGAVSLGRPSQELLDISFDLLVQYQDLPAEPPIDEYFDWSFLPDPAPSC